METMDNVRTKKGMTKYTSSMKETRVPDNAFENVERKYAKLFLKELISSFSKWNIAKIINGLIIGNIIVRSRYSFSSSQITFETKTYKMLFQDRNGKRN